MSLEPGKEIWIRYRYLGVINMQVVNKNIRLNDTIKGASTA